MSFSQKKCTSLTQYISLGIVLLYKRRIMASDKAQYVVALIAEFAEHYGITTADAAKYLSQYKALDLYDRQYGYLHTQSFASNVRDLSAYCRRMGGTL